MEWNISKTEKNNEIIDKSGYFEIFGNRYTREDNPIIFFIGGYLTSFFFLLMGSAMLCSIILISSLIGSAIFMILGVVLLAAILACVAGFIKYIITGNGRPFVNIQTDEKSYKISFFDW